MRPVRRMSLVAAAALSVALAIPVPASSAPAQGKPSRATSKPIAHDLDGFAYAPGVVLVGLEPRVGATASDELRRAYGVMGSRVVGRGSVGRAERWKLPPGLSVEAAIAQLERDPSIRYAEPDWKVHSLTADDPYYTDGRLWGMLGDATVPANQYGSQAGEAWAAGATGSSSVYIGVIDEGIQTTHPDLDDNIWVNPFDPIGGGDDDGNGYVDDTNGWDFFYNDRTVYDAGEDHHGTHVSGTIGGEGNNGLGVAGVNWDVTLISGKFLGPSGGYLSAAVSAVDYFTDLKTRHGLNIVATSNSWGGGGFSQTLLDAIERGGDAGILFIAAAGNGGSDNDVYESYPSNYQCTRGGTRGWDCVIAVAAIESSGALASFSQYGDVTVDIGAPGVAVWSTVPTNSYDSYSGTSMATPHVSGAAALCAASAPGLTAREVREAIMASATPTASLTGKTVTGGRLNVSTLLETCAPAVAPPDGVPTGLVAAATGPRAASLTWTDTSTNESSFEVQRATGSPGSCGTWSTLTFAGRNAVTLNVTGLLPSTDYCFRIRARNSYGGGSSSAWSAEAGARTSDVVVPGTPSALTATSPAARSVRLAWTDNASNEGSFQVMRALGAPGSCGVWGAAMTVAADVTSATIPGLTPSTSYCFRVRALAQHPDDPSSGWSSEIGATTLAPPAPYTCPTTTYAWIDASGGTDLGLGDESLEPVTAPFPVTIYGTQTADLFVSSNGWVGLGATTSEQDWVNQDIPATPDPDGIVAPFWDDLDPGSWGQVMTHVTGSAPNRRFVVAWLDVPHYDYGGAVSFQVVFSESDPAIVLQYQDVAFGSTSVNAGRSATVGLEDEIGGSGTRISFNTASLVNSRSYRCSNVGGGGGGDTLSISTTTFGALTAGSTMRSLQLRSSGVTPLAWSVVGGTLPPGLMLLSSGRLSGSPTTAGPYSVSIRVTDATGATGQRTFSGDIAMSKRSPSNFARLSTGVTSVSLVWYPHVDAMMYRYCVATSSGACTSWTETGMTSATAAVPLRRTGYVWQVEAYVGGTWVPMNGGALWRFTTGR